MSPRPVDELDRALLGGARPAPHEGPRWRVVLDVVRGALLDNLALKFVALVLALTVFVLVHSDEAAVVGATVSVSYTLPEGRVLVSPRVEQLRVTVKGSRRRIRRFDPAELERVNLDLRARGDGDLVFTPEMIEGLPDGLEVVSIAPPSMRVELGERAERSVPVVVETEGRPADGFRVARAAAEPVRVTVVGAAATVAKVAAVRTEPVVVDGRRGPFGEEVALVAPEGTSLEGSGRVRIEVAFDEEQALRNVGPLPIAVRGGPGGARLVVEPASALVVLRGGAAELERVDAGALAAFVRVSGAELSGGARPTVEVRLSPALRGVGVELVPPVVTVSVAP